MSNTIRNEMETKWKVILYQLISTLNSVESLFGDQRIRGDRSNDWSQNGRPDRLMDSRNGLGLI